MPPQWTPAEDAALGALVAEHGRQWQVIARLLAKSSKSCSSRWYNCVKLGASRRLGAWSPYELRHLMRHVERRGTKWLDIETECIFPGRSSNDIKNTYYGVVRKQERAAADGTQTRKLRPKPNKRRKQRPRPRGPHLWRAVVERRTEQQVEAWISPR
jgi:hypothetical protein